MEADISLTAPQIVLSAKVNTGGSRTQVKTDKIQHVSVSKHHEKNSTRGRRKVSVLAMTSPLEISSVPLTNHSVRALSHAHLADA